MIQDMRTAAESCYRVQVVKRWKRQMAERDMARKKRGSMGVSEIDE